jgi:hypothetical protein
LHNAGGSSKFLKEKLLLEPKLKARLVAGGHMQDRSVYSEDETSSPTVSNSALCIVATISENEGRKVRTMDIGSAHLNAEIQMEVLMVIQPSLTKILCSIAPAYSNFMREDGCSVVKLLKALYGCVESSKLWYDDVKKELTKLGFTPNSKDECVFNKVMDGHLIILCIYVDDLFATSIDEADLESIRAALVQSYGEVTYSDG